MKQKPAAKTKTTTKVAPKKKTKKDLKARAQKSTVRGVSVQNTRYAVGNWKMNPEDKESAEALFSGIAVYAKRAMDVTTVVCPPFVFLDTLHTKSKRSKIQSCTLGAQNISAEEAGAHTGEVSVSQAVSVGATYTIIGHSERRSEQGESDELINRKVRTALAGGLSVIVCVGESEHDEHGHFYEFVAHQIRAALADVQNKDLSRVIVAYEPIWAIGKGEQHAMTPHDLREMTIFIKRTLHDLYKVTDALKVPILYGGSVSPANVGELVAEGEVQGVLVGGASLSSERFGAIINTLARLPKA